MPNTRQEPGAFIMSSYRPTGCALTFDSCWNSPCQNGGVCVNLPGVEAFFCDNCPSHYGGPTCETYCGPDQECVRVYHIS